MTNLKIKTKVVKSIHTDRDKMAARKILSTLVTLLDSPPISYDDIFITMKSKKVTEVDIEL